MAKKLFITQRPVTILVPRLTGGSDPSRGINPKKASSTYTFQHIIEVPGKGQDLVGEGSGTRMGMLAGDVEPAQATVEIVDNDFTKPAILTLGSYRIVSGTNWIPGGTDILSAEALATYINALPEYQATHNDTNTITITGPVGPTGNFIRFESTYEGDVANFTLTPSTGSMGDAGPVIGPPELG